jgi:hypothetical protein
MVLGKLDINIRKMKLEPHLSSFIKLKSKWIKTNNIKEEEVEDMLQHLDIGKDFVSRPPVAQKARQRIINGIS